MRVLVCGGRNFAGFGDLVRFLDRFNKERGPIKVVIEGEAFGADQMARRWAEENGIPVLPFHANWERLGNMAGSLRNGRMLREGKPDVVIAFPGDTGTSNMVAQAYMAGVEVIKVGWQTEKVNE